MLQVTRRDRYVWPAEGPITSYFGPGHPTGIDIALDPNNESPIRAAGDGRVIAAGGDPCCGLGIHVEIEHDNGGKTVYGHLSRVDVGENAQIKQGDQLGLGGSTGNADGKHLHFEVYENGMAVDPLLSLPAEQQARSGVERVSCAESVLRVDPASILDIRITPRTVSGYEISTIAYTGLTTTARSMAVVATKTGILTASISIPPLGAATGETLDAGLDILLKSPGTPDQQVTCRISLRTRQTLPNPPGTGDRHVGAANETPQPTPTITSTPTRTPIPGLRVATPLAPTPVKPAVTQPTPIKPGASQPTVIKPPVLRP